MEWNAERSVWDHCSKFDLHFWIPQIHVPFTKSSLFNDFMAYNCRSTSTKCSFSGLNFNNFPCHVLVCSCFWFFPTSLEIYEPRLFIDSRLLFSMQTYLWHRDQLWFGSLYVRKLQIGMHDKYVIFTFSRFGRCIGNTFEHFTMIV